MLMALDFILLLFQIMQRSLSPDRLGQTITNTNTFISGKNPYTIGTYISTSTYSKMKSIVLRLTG